MSTDAVRQCLWMLQRSVAFFLFFRGGLCLDERAILLQFYNESYGSQPWSNNTYWGSETPICLWHGVHCSTNNSDTGVVEISLPNNNMAGKIPPLLYALPSLQKIDLSFNQIFDAGFEGMLSNLSTTGIQSINFGGCSLRSVEGIASASSSLHELLLSRNQIRINFPTEICSLTSLVNLHLGFNAMAGTLPSCISNLSNLQEFYLTSNMITGPLPNEIGKLTKLTVLAFSENRFNSTIPNQVNYLTNLEIFALHHELDPEDALYEDSQPRLTGPLPSFSDSSSLSKVFIGNNALTSTIPSNFLAASRHIGNSIVVNLENNLLTGTIPQSLDQFESLTIDLTGNHFEGPLPETFCAKGRWMNGLVAVFGCAAILCPEKTYNRAGQQISSTEKCIPCASGGAYLGSKECLAGPETSSVDAGKILAEVYLALGGAGWYTRKGWDILDDALSKFDIGQLNITGITFCEFHGVVCDGKGGVSVLNLANNGLQGTIPESLYELPGLRVLDLSYNRVMSDSKTHLEPLRQARDLKRLVLSQTAIESMDGIGGGASLVEVWMDGCYLESTISTEIFQLLKLEILNLAASHLHGTIAHQIGKLSSLRSLSLNENRLSGSLPHELGDLLSLSTIDLSDNLFSSTLPSSLNSMPYLRSLKINRAQGGLGGQLLSFRHLPLIEELELGFNNFSSSIPTDFLSGRKVKSQLVIGLTANKIQGEIPTSLASISDNLIIELEDNMITSIPQELCNMTKWMGGEVGRVSDGCKAILCPSGTWSPNGRASLQLGVECSPCEGNKYYGETSCEAIGLKTNIEVEILDTLFIKTGGDYWNATHINWTKAGVPICYREGVYCGYHPQDMNSGVTELRLNNFGLLGRIPVEVYKLPQIRLLGFSYNAIDLSFEGIEIAEALEVLLISRTNLKSLKGIEKAGSRFRELHVSDNQLETTTFPSELLALTNLLKLFIDNNKLSGTIPTELATLLRLQKLQIASNLFFGPIPSELSLLSNLQLFDASDNLLSGPMPTELVRLRNLQQINLAAQRSKPKITGSLVAFNASPLLTEVYVSKNSLEGTIPSSLLASVDRRAAVRLDLSYNQLTGSIPIEFDTFENLNIDVVANLISEIPDKLCDNLNWMNGVVAVVAKTDRCNAILCPPGTSSPYGRLMDAQSKCELCPTGRQEAPYYGSLSCLDLQEKTERKALMFFYQNLNGEHWAFQQDWLTEKHVCSWYGVSCNEKYSVVALKLPSNRLQAIGTEFDVLSVLSFLPNLNELDLSGSQVNLDFKSLSMYSPLESLVISRTGTASLAGISKVSNLKILDAADNNIVGSFPEELLKLKGLTRLYLSYNKLNGTLFEISRLSSLEALFLQSNNLQGMIPSELENLSRLKELSLGLNLLSGELVTSITLPKLEHLELQNQRSEYGINGTLLNFSNTPRLRYLDLSDNSITGYIPSQFLVGCNKSDSIKVNLMNNDLTGSVPLSLDDFVQLDLELGGNRITQLPSQLCDNYGWMNGDVGAVGSCSAILCPAGQYSDHGRQTSVNLPCMPCDSLVLSPVLGNTHCGELKSEREILELLFIKTAGETWENKASWMTDVPICAWAGIECDGSEQDDKGVVILNLEANNLRGSLPSQIWTLPMLHEVNLRDNPELQVSLEASGHASETLFSLFLANCTLQSFRGLSKMQHLIEFDASHMTGTFPTEILDLNQSLVSLNLSNNFFVGTLPSRIGELKYIRQIYLQNNDLHSSLPSTISKLSHLRELVLDDNLLSGPLVPDTFSFLAHLKILSVNRMFKSGRKISGRLPSMDNMPQLFSLLLSGNDLSGSIPSYGFLASSSSLAILDLSRNSLTGSIPSDLGEFSSLNLILSDNKIVALPSTLCNTSAGILGCDAILCPPNWVSQNGRATRGSDGLNCTRCPDVRESPFFGSTSCQLVINERNVLLELFQKTTGPQWHRNDFWATSVDYCDWFGVVCENEQVTMIDLHANNLVGSLISDVFRLSHLKVLIVGSNAIEVSLDNVGEARNLMDLRIDNTIISSIKGIGSARSLTSFDARSNGLGGSLPEELANLRNLRVLDLSDNDFSGTIPSFENNRFLRIVRLKKNKLAGLVPSFRNSVVLREIVLAQNNLQNGLPFDFFQHTPFASHLVVDLSQNFINGSIPRELERFESMQIDLTSNRIQVLPALLCNKTNWNMGEVGKFGCDALLCPPGTFNSLGRRSEALDCIPCRVNATEQLYGQRSCDGATSFAIGTFTRSTLWVYILCIPVLITFL